MKCFFSRWTVFSLIAFFLVEVSTAVAEVAQTNDLPTTAVPCHACKGTRKCYDCNGTKEERCKQCNGDGKKRDRCSRCGGSGRVSKTTRSFGKTRRTTTSCSSCSGRGYNNRTCSTCGGDGKIKCSKCKGTGQCPTCFKPAPQPPLQLEAQPSSIK